MKTVFRYPGAKNRLLPQILPFLDSKLQTATYFSDAFVGGGSVLLEVAERYPKIQLLCNDKDEFVFCFWNLMANGTKAEIAELKQMLAEKPTIKLFYKLRETPPASDVEAAYRAVFFNRTSFSGDMRRAASPIGGKNQNSQYTVDCRYNSKKIVSKIDRILKLLHSRTFVTNNDIIQHLLVQNEGIVAYLDPPYWHKGKMLYQEYMKDKEHTAMAELLKNKDNWILSYDNCSEILDLYKWANIHFIDATYCIRGTKSNWIKTKEVLITPV